MPPSIVLIVKYCIQFEQIVQIKINMTEKNLFLKVVTKFIFTNRKKIVFCVSVHDK